MSSVEVLNTSEAKQTHNFLNSKSSMKWSTAISIGGYLYKISSNRHQGNGSNQDYINIASFESVLSGLLGGNQFYWHKRNGWFLRFCSCTVSIYRLPHACKDPMSCTECKFRTWKRDARSRQSNYFRIANSIMHTNTCDGWNLAAVPRVFIGPHEHRITSGWRQPRSLGCLLVLNERTPPHLSESPLTWWTHVIPQFSMVRVKDSLIS